MSHQPWHSKPYINWGPNPSTQLLSFLLLFQCTLCFKCKRWVINCDMFSRCHISTSLLSQLLRPGISSPFPRLRSSALIMCLLISSNNVSFLGTSHSLLNFTLVPVTLLLSILEPIVSLPLGRELLKDKNSCLHHLCFPCCVWYLALVGDQQMPYEWKLTP